MWFRETPIGRLGQTHPAQKNDKKNVHEEPYFRSLSVSNNWPSQARSEAHKLILNPPNHHKSQSLDTKISIQSVTNMTPLHCVFTLSLFWWPEPLKYINGWVFLWKGLGLQRTTLWTAGNFWRRSGLLLINWRAPVTGTIFLVTSCRTFDFPSTRPVRPRQFFQSSYIQAYMPYESSEVSSNQPDGTKGSHRCPLDPLGPCRPTPWPPGTL